MPTSKGGVMKFLLLVILLIYGIESFALICNAAGEYRCKDGRTGLVLGQGSSLEAAKLRARDRAREICGGLVDYVRFNDSTSHC
jgi:hypothetical protein